MSYRPDPIDTEAPLPDDLLELTELLARNAHDVWARLRLAQGWRWGPQRNDAAKEHPSLVPYEALPESEKQADRDTVIGTLKAIRALGYRVEKIDAGRRRGES
jgi:ryanodine receptor 2